jgi:hypothetical protein
MRIGRRNMGYKRNELRVEIEKKKKKQKCINKKKFKKNNIQNIPSQQENIMSHGILQG